MPVALRVHHNGDDVLLSWHILAAIPECRGFAIRRRLNGHAAVPLPSYAGFANEPWTKGCAPAVDHLADPEVLVDRLHDHQRRHGGLLGRARATDRRGADAAGVRGK